jgi:hypothetical protein
VLEEVGGIIQEVNEQLNRNENILKTAKKFSTDPVNEAFVKKSVKSRGSDKIKKSENGSVGGKVVVCVNVKAGVGFLEGPRNRIKRAVLL